MFAPRAHIQPLLRGHKYALFIFLRSVFWLLKLTKIYTLLSGILIIFCCNIDNKLNFRFHYSSCFLTDNNPDFLQPPRNSTQREKNPYICGLRARIECEPLSEHSTHSDRVTNIGVLLSLGASVSMGRLFL